MNQEAIPISGRRAGTAYRDCHLEVDVEAQIEERSPLVGFVPAMVVRRFAARSAPPLHPEVDEILAAALFADIAGFTPLAEQMAARGARGAEELTDLLNRYFGRMIEVIDAHGGEVVKFAGDALLALWPAADGDLGAATRRAALAGLRLHSALAGFTREADARLTLRIGIGAGRVSVLYVGGGPGDRWECVPTGDPLAQMAVAEHEAQEGEVVLSAQAWEAAGASCLGSPRGHDTMRLEAVRDPAPPKPSPALPPSPHDAPLAAFVSSAIRARVAAGQADWLSELRRVTVLFIHLHGLEGGDPARLLRTQAAFTRLEAALDRFEASVDKLSVDDKGMIVLAVLGLPPRAHLDDPARGLLAALAARAALAEEGVLATIGVATGRVFCGVVGNADRHEYTVIGDAVNLGARLMAAAQGGILCDDSTHEAARGRLGFGPPRWIPVKGKAQPVRVHEPLADAAPERAEALLVGRQRERDILEAACEAVAQGGSRLILLEGEAGLGKSRMVDAFRQIAEERGLGVLAGAAAQVGQGTPYLAWREPIGELLGLDPNDRASRGARIQARAAADPTLARLAPLLRDVIGADLPETDLTQAMAGEARAFSTQDLLVHLLQQEAKQGALAVILEDGHWLDSASLALLRQVVKRVSPLLVLLSSRPHDAAGFDALRAAPDTVELRLRPLNLEDTRALLLGRLGRPPGETLTRLVFQRAEGNPFFTEELALALRETGALSLVDGALELDGDPARALGLPETVQAAILARIDRLEPREQLSLKVASVIGRTIPLGLLAHIYPVAPDRPRLRGALEALERLDLTTAEAPEPDPTWLYKHETTREVAYGLLLFSQRRQLHQAVAEALEARDPQELPQLYPLLAWHWGQADEPARTLHYLELAGDQAVLEGAYQEAVHALEAAIALHEAHPDLASHLRRAHCARQLGEAYLGLGKLPESRAALSRAVDLLGYPVPAGTLPLAGGLMAALARQLRARLLGRRPQPMSEEERATRREAALAWLRIIETCFYLAGPTETLHAALSALDISEPAGPSPELARSAALVGWIVSMVPAFSITDAYLRLAADLIATPEGSAAAQPVLFFTGFSRVAQGRWAEGDAALAEAVALAERVGDTRRWIEAVCGWSTLLHYQGRYEERVQMGAEVLYTSARRQGDAQAEAWGILDQLESLLPLGDMDRAGPLLDALEPFLERDIGRSEQVWGRGLLAMGRSRQGREEEALQAALGANQASAGLAPVAVYCFEGYAGAASVLLSLLEKGKPVQAAVRSALAALDRYAKVFPIARPRALLCRGQLTRIEGKQGRAVSLLREAHAAAVTLAMPLDEGMALVELGRCLDDTDTREAGELILTRLGVS